MGKRIATWSFLTCCCLTSSVPALTADDYVLTGRARMFDGTVTGLVEADDIFAAGRNDTGCPDCRCDRELTLLHAITKTALLFVDHNDIMAPDGLFRLAEEFGIPLAVIAPYDAPRELVGHEQGGSLWAGGADRETSRQRLRDSVLPALEGIINQLGSITDSPDPFVVYLVPSETGLAGDVEIDYGDVLIFKGLLLAYKGLLAAESVQGACAGQADAGAPYAPHDLGPYDEQQDRVLDSPLVLTMLSRIEKAGAGDEWLAQARRNCADALTCYLEAVEFIAAEDDPAGSDPQEDELVYVDGEAPPRLSIYREALATLRNSLIEGTGAAHEAHAMRAYDVYDASATRLGELSLAFDCTGTEGRTGRLVLGDGSSLEVEWFCLFEEGDIGVSLFSHQGAEAWLEGDMGHDGGAIVNGRLDLWGTRSRTTTGTAARGVDTIVPPAVGPWDLPSPYAQVLADGLGGSFEAWTRPGASSLLAQ